ncbi:MAG: DUF6113 family protein [Jatrophihabitantaceae bacterium]
MTAPRASHRPKPRPATAPPPVAAGRQPAASLPILIAGYLIFVTAGALCAAYEVLLVPTRWGSTLIPIAPVLAILSNLALPIIARRLTDTAGSAVPPVLGWFVATFVLASARPEGDVLLPAGSTAWVSYGLLICGALAALIALAAGDRPGRWIDGWLSRRSARPDSDSDGAP